MLPKSPNSTGKPIINPRRARMLVKNIGVGKTFPPTAMNHQRKDKAISKTLPVILSKRVRVLVSKAQPIAKRARIVPVEGYIETKRPKFQVKTNMHNPEVRDR